MITDDARWCVRPGGQKAQGFPRSRLPIASSHVPAVNNPFETPIPIIAEGIDLAAVQGSFLGVCDEVRAGALTAPRRAHPAQPNPRPQPQAGTSRLHAPCFVASFSFLFVNVL